MPISGFVYTFYDLDNLLAKLLSAVSVHDAQSRCVKKHLMFTAVNIFFQFYDSLTVAENPFLDLYQVSAASIQRLIHHSGNIDAPFKSLSYFFFTREEAPNVVLYNELA